MSNPYISAILGIFADMRVWILSLVGGVAGVVAAKYGIEYLQGDEMEKRAAKQGIKSTAIWGGGIFMLIWFITYVIDKMKAVNP